jgi:photosystem II stability/assembly factor-like uncharacterized protein
MKRAILIILNSQFLILNCFAQSGWVTQSSGTSDNLRCIQFLDANTGYAVSFYEKLLKTTNGGTNWQVINLTLGGNEQTIFFINSLTGWAGTFNGKIAKTTDGGVTWTIQYTASSPVEAIEFANSQTGYAACQSGTGLKTTNGGTTWSQVTPVISYCYGLDVLNENTVYVCGGSSNIFFSSDGGANWTMQNSGGPQLNAIKFANSLTGYAVGGGGHKKTTNGGLNWVSMDGGLTSNSYFSISVYNSSTLWAVGNFIKHSSDGGANWRTQDSLTGGASYTSSSFINNLTGWVCGTGGIIKKTTTGGFPPPAAPTNLTATAVSTYRINLSWTDNSTNEINFKIDRSLNNVNYTLIDSVPANTTTYSDSSLTSGTTYYYRVYASNLSGNSNYSNVASALTFPAAPVLVSPPNGATGVSLTPTLFWNGVPTTISYRIQLSDDSTFAVTITNDNTGNTYYYIPPNVLQNNVRYFWRVNSTNASGTGPWSAVWNFRTGPVGVEPVGNEIPKEFKLYNNYPNPFNPATKIKFDIPKSAFTKVVVYDMTGREVKILMNEVLNPGRYEIEWNAADYSSGVYLYRIEAGAHTDIKKMILVR